MQRGVTNIKLLAEPTTGGKKKKKKKSTDAIDLIFYDLGSTIQTKAVIIVIKLASPLTHLSVTPVPFL